MGDGLCRAASPDYMNMEQSSGKQSVRRAAGGNSEQMHSKISLEPVFLLCVLVISIFVGEAVITLLLPGLIPPLYDTTVIDALLLVVIVFPVLYLFSFRPLQSHIAELNRMQESLNRSEEQYRSLVESTDDSIYLVNRDYKYLFMNKRHQSRMGFSDNQFMGRPYGDFHSPEGTREFEKRVDAVFSTGESVQQEHKSHRDNRYFLRTFSPIKNAFGRVEAVTVVSKDITTLI